MVGFVLGLHDGDSYIHGVGGVVGLLRMVNESQMIWVLSMKGGILTPMPQ